MAIGALCIASGRPRGTGLDAAALGPTFLQECPDGFGARTLDLIATMNDVNGWLNGA